MTARVGTRLEEAAQLLEAGEVVAIPTETVYGLAANALDADACLRVFEVKERPAFDPLIVHVADAAQARAFAAQWPPLAERLAAAFWPGPLTLIVPRRAGMAAAAAGRQDSIGLRCPAHPLAQALLTHCAARGVPGVAAPSANRFGRVSPTTAAHVSAEFGANVTVLDGGPCTVGIESAIVDCSRGAPVLLRPGALTREALAAAAGAPIGDADDQAPRASGTLEAHYAPSATVRLMPPAALSDALAIWAEARAAVPRGAARAKPTLAVYSRTARVPGHAADLGLVVRSMPSGARAAAFELFSVLREMDSLGVGLIWVEQPPPGSEWDGVRDRLQRAAAASKPS